MKLIFSRKGFDSSSGGGPSPIVRGGPVTLPIPAHSGPSRTTYGALGLGEHVAAASRGALGAGDPCHHDPMFLDGGRALLGQCGAAQTHLARAGVGEGDLFLFFGLFRAAGGKPHHRIFGYLAVADVLPLADAPERELAGLRALGFPHALGLHARNDTLYSGAGRATANASNALRLTVPEGPPSTWQVPAFLAATGLTYHGRADRWLPGNRLRSVSRGQEFVADIGQREDARGWVEAMVAVIEG